MPNLLVAALLRSFCRLIEGICNCFFILLFEVLSRRELIRTKTLIVIVAQGGAISDNPSFHCLNHQMDMICWYAS